MKLLPDQPCHICGVPIPTWTYGMGNHPLAPSRDHVVPVVRGGKNLPNNLRAAHRCCNTRRGSDRLTKVLRAKCRKIAMNELVVAGLYVMARWMKVKEEMA